MKHNLSLAILFSSTLLFACNQKPTVSNEPIPFQPLLNGQTSGYYLEKEHVFFIPTSQKWHDFLNIHGQNETMPNVDFDKNVIIAIVDKNHSTGGFNLKINEIRKSNNNTEVFLTRDIPGTHCMTTMMMTQPFVIVTVPKTKVAEPVVIHTKEYAVNC